MILSSRAIWRTLRTRGPGVHGDGGVFRRGRQASSRGLCLRIGGEGADAEAGGAACLVIPHRPGNVEVRPRRVADELLVRVRVRVRV